MTTEILTLENQIAIMEAISSNPTTDDDTRYELQHAIKETDNHLKKLRHEQKKF